MSDLNNQAENDTVEQTPADAPSQETATEQAVSEPVAEVVETAPAPTPQPAKKVVAPVQAKPAAAPQKAAAEPAPARTEEKLSVVVQMAFESIHGYIEAMAPRRPLSIDEGCRNQVSLYRAITTIINRSDDDFQPAFAKLLKLFEEHATGALAETHVFRFLDNVQLPEDDRRAFQRLINLIKVAGPVKGRELAVKQVDFAASLKYGLTEQGRQRVLAFFGK